MGKKSNAKRKQGLKEMAQGVKQMYLTSAKGAAKGIGKGLVQGFEHGTGLADKVAKGVIGSVTKGVGGAIGDVAKGNLKFIKGMAKAIFNDLGWYENYPELLKGMSGANFSIDDSIESSYNNTGSTTQSKAQIVTHTITLTNGASDKMRHMAMQKIFESTRRANNGYANFSEADINKYYIIIRNIVALASILKRGYGLTNMYTSANLSVPNLYLHALGLDSTDFINNSANIREYLKKLAMRLEVYVPLNLPIIERTEWLFSCLFKDSDDIKAQKHAFNLGGYLHFDPTTNTWGTRDFYPLNLHTSTQVITAIEDEMTSLVAACPAGIIAGDMLKAFGVDRVYHFGDTDQDYVARVGYSEEVLTQIQNLVSYSNLVMSAATDTNGLVYMDITLPAIVGNMSSSALAKRCVDDLNEPQINFYKNDIENVEIIGASRFILSAQNNVTTASTNIKLEYGTEIAEASNIWYLEGGTITYVSQSTYRTSNYTTINSALQQVKGWCAIDWMPRFNIELDYYNGSGTALRTSVVDCWDYNNSGFLSIKSLHSYHDVAYVSMYYVPLLSKEQPNLVEVKS